MLNVSLSSVFSLIGTSIKGRKKHVNNEIDTLWEKGVACFLKEDDRGAIENFENLLLIINKKNVKYYSSFFYVAHSYRTLLKTQGLNEIEANRMFECYETCLEQGTTVNNSTSREIKKFMERKMNTRPQEYVDIWIDKTD